MSTAPAPDLGSGDDIVLPFDTIRSGVKGRLVRLGASIDSILSRHAYPDPVSETLGHAIALTALLGATLGTDGRLSLQTKSDGPIGFLFVDLEAPGKLRATASFSADRVEAAASEQRSRIPEGALLGRGYLALTLDPGGGQDRAQGIVELNGDSISAAAHAYFRQSEQLPTYLRLAIAKHRVAGGTGPESWRWRAGGLIVQHMGRTAGGDESESLDAMMAGSEEDWQRARILAATVEDHELVDPTLAPDRLLYRLFHEEGIRAYPERPVDVYCRCSRERVLAFMKSFSAEDLAGMAEPDGGYTVTCEFCSTKYRFEAGDLE